MRGLTRRQKEVLEFLKAFHAQEDRLPNTREIQRKFIYRSQTSGVDMLRALERKGVIERRGGWGGWYRFTRKKS